MTVPFFPQTEYQCGPAALATVLVHEGVDVTPDELTPQVYIPARRGSLQVEMLAAARRAGRIPYVIDANPDALAAELEARQPVLVLQDLMPRPLRRLGASQWHYAVVVGHEAERDVYVLRSGTERRRLEPARRFLSSWDAGERWGVVIVPPGDLPATAVPARFLRAVVDSAPTLPPEGRARAWASMLERWPEDPLILFGVANAAYAEGRIDEAAPLYRRLIELDPDHAAARNNYANVLLDLGCPAEARREAEAAHRAAGSGAFAEAVGDTLARASTASEASSGTARPTACPGT